MILFIYLFIFGFPVQHRSILPNSKTQFDEFTLVLFKKNKFKAFCQNLAGRKYKNPENLRNSKQRGGGGWRGLVSYVKRKEIVININELKKKNS
jgi:hypothetical protein